MAEETEVEQSVIGNFVVFLKELQTKVSQSNPQHSGLCSVVISWEYPPLGKESLAQKLGQLIDYIESHQFQENRDLSQALNDYQEAFSQWSGTPLSHLYNSSYCKSAIYNFLILLTDVRGTLERYDQGLLTKELQARAVSAKRRLGALESRITASEVSIDDVEKAAQRIVEADKAAVQLPETLSSLKNAEADVSLIKTRAEQAQKTILTAETTTKAKERFFVETEEQIKALLEKSKAVLATATSSGLAGAFYDRKKELQRIGWIWTGGLICALVGAIFAIWWRADQLFALLDRANEIGTFTLLANFVISIGFIGAPVWLAWLATKQVGYYFRLSEDYAFKASVSASYEGFMEEARGHDAEFEKKVLESTLERYDEPPLRFVDNRVHGSPYHELFESDEFKSAMKNIPGFKDNVLSAIKGCLRTSAKADSPVEEKPPVDSK